MVAVAASMTQGGEVVARASALYLRRGEQPDGIRWTMPISMPPVPEQSEHLSNFNSATPHVHPGIRRQSGGFPSQCDGPRHA